MMMKMMCVNYKHDYTKRMFVCKYLVLKGHGGLRDVFFYIYEEINKTLIDLSPTTNIYLRLSIIATNSTQGLYIFKY